MRALCLQVGRGCAPQPPRGLEPRKLDSKHTSVALKPIMRAFCLQIGGLLPPPPQLRRVCKILSRVFAMGGLQSPNPPPVLSRASLLPKYMSFFETHHAMIVSARGTPRADENNG